MRFISAQLQPSFRITKLPSGNEQISLATYTPGFISIDALGWFGCYTRSPNKQWLLSWIEGYAPEVDEEDVHGEYLLYDCKQKVIVLRGLMERPDNGSVSNNGLFSLESNSWRSGSRGSRFYVFDSSGNDFLAVEFDTLLVTSSISKNAKYAVCHTAGRIRPDDDDGSSLFLFDLPKGECLYKTIPQCWPQRYEIDENSGYLIAHAKDLGSFRYDDHGILIDATELEQARLDSKDFTCALWTAGLILERPELSHDRIREVLEVIKRARRNGADDNPGWKAGAIKRQGLAYEALGEAVQAVEAYEEALAIDPNIGVKRRLAALKKRL